MQGACGFLCHCSHTPPRVWPPRASPVSPPLKSMRYAPNLGPPPSFLPSCSFPAHHTAQRRCLLVIALTRLSWNLSAPLTRLNFRGRPVMNQRFLPRIVRRWPLPFPLDTSLGRPVPATTCRPSMLKRRVARIRPILARGKGRKDGV